MITRSQVESSSRHSTLEVDRINHQFLEAGNGSSPLAYLILVPAVDPIILSSRTELIDKMPVLQVQHQVHPRAMTMSSQMHTFTEDQRMLRMPLNLLPTVTRLCAGVDPEADPEEDGDEDPEEDPIDYPADGGR
ncbi:hypothetical protein Tco_0549426 [Tanacetum coccineum]